MNALESPQEWLSRLKLEGFLRPLRHPGNLRFAFSWTDRCRTSSPH
jgi:hypothetical protein